MSNLARVYERVGRINDALPLCEQAFKVRKAAAAAGRHPDTLASMAGLACILLDQKKYADAEPLLRSCLAIRAKKEPDLWNSFNTRSLLGGCLLGQGQYADAEPLLLLGYEGMKQRIAKIEPENQIRVTEALERLVQLYEATGKQEQAARWRQELEAVQTKAKQAKK